MKLKLAYYLSFFILVIAWPGSNARAGVRDTAGYVQDICDYSFQAINSRSVEEARYYAGQAVVAADNATLQAYQDGLNVPAVFINDVYLYSKKAEQADTLENLQDDARKVIAAAEAIQYSLQHGYLRN
jgi:hypothetical protein